MSGLDDLKAEYKGCCRCRELCQNRTNVVFGVGEPDKAKILIIGEAPGKQEDLQNEPFVGRSGQVLTELLMEVGLSRTDVYITNTILCRPPNNRDPTREELDNCSDRLARQIRLIAPSVVVTLGNFATRYMLQTKKGITALHGRPQHKDSMTIIPMFHPAVLLYSGNNPEKRAQLLDDFKVAKQLLDGGASGQGTLNSFM